MKYRALRLDAGNFSWGSERVARKCRILDVVYNASNNELVRTKTLVKNTIVAIDAAPFKLWYKKTFGSELGKKKTAQKDAPVEDEAKPSAHVVAKRKQRLAKHVVDGPLEEQFTTGRLLACVSSRPGQVGRCDGYLLEGEELLFYKRRMDKKKHK